MTNSLPTPPEDRAARQRSDIVGVLVDHDIHVAVALVDDLLNVSKAYAKQEADKALSEWIMKNEISSFIGFVLSAEALRPDSNLNGWADSAVEHAKRVQKAIDPALTKENQ